MKTKNEKIFKKKIKNDDNNTHDRMVNELSIYYYNYIKTNTIIEYDLDDIIIFINNLKIEELNKLNKNLILNYLNYLLLYNDNIINFECNEYDLLILCWNRALMEINKKNTKKIQMNILNNIIDYYYTEYDILNKTIKKKLYCTSGRIMKLFSSFCYLDYNETLGCFLSREILRNEFLNKASIKYNDNITYDEYDNELDQIIEEYNEIYHKQLKLEKKILIESLIF